MPFTREPSTKSGAEGASSVPVASEGRSASLRGMTYTDQVQALSPARAPVQMDATNAGASAASDVKASDIPSVLYSNTSKTNLNKTADWPARLGFALAQEYEAQVSFRDLVLAGRTIHAPPAARVGRVVVPPGANTSDAKEYDFIKTPTGQVVEAGSNRFPLRGGADAADEPVTLRFANNGGLNLARLARAAYELAVAKGVEFTPTGIDWKGQTFALSCAVQMGNAVEASAARAFGYMGEFDLKWMQEKVHATVETLAMTTVAAAGRGITQKAKPDDRRWMHPYHENTGFLQAPVWEQQQTASGGTASARTQGVTPIESKTFRHETVRSWGDTKETEKAWVKDPVELAARAQHRLAGSWAPGADWHGHPTYITACPDFTDVLATCFQASMGTFETKDTVAKHVLAAVASIGARLQLAPMNHDLIEDPAHQRRLEVANKAVIAQAFAQVGVGKILECLNGLDQPRETPVQKPSDRPVASEAPNDEGLVVLRDWSSRDGE